MRYSEILLLLLRIGIVRYFQHHLHWNCQQDRVFGRFTQSFIKQYTEQEYRRLLAEANTSPLACIVLVAIETTNNTCVGSLDLCLDAQSQSELGADILQGGVYIQNVAVSIDKRGRGVGRCLVENAKKYAWSKETFPFMLMWTRQMWQLSHFIGDVALTM
jgi:ribosomal protein S18 acetylase RimI-like enzyme